MSHEVVVVGGGIGGLTVAALLAARGVNVCLLERESRAGGCAANIEAFDYSFEPGAGLYTGWDNGEIYERIFNELAVEPPPVSQLEPSYVVRLPDKRQVALTSDTERFESNLTDAFPECPDAAIQFYGDATRVSNYVTQAMDFRTGTTPRRFGSSLLKSLVSRSLRKSDKESVAHHLSQTSSRFRRFIDVQLQELVQGCTEECSYAFGSMALSLARKRVYAITGGPSTLVGKLVESIKSNGGIVRMDTPVLRLAYDKNGRTVGVDLLSGETVTASKAIVSNMTIWDTYGKLVGLNRTPASIRQQLKTLRGWGAYMLYLGMDETAAERLPADRILVLTDWQVEQPYNPEANQFMFACTPAWDPRAPQGKRAVTIHTFTDVDEWFTYHEDEMEHERKDQAVLEDWWERVHSALPELGSEIEVIDTATPLSFYELTRRKLGMVGGIGRTLSTLRPNLSSHRTSLPNLFLVGDTTLPGPGLNAVTYSALIVANEIQKG